jgi:predicted O-methyltransferase YrrM
MSDSTAHVVQQLLESATGKTMDGNGAFIRAGMSLSELVHLYELALAAQSGDALEVGMANGTSAVVLCGALSARGSGTLTSIDPFQTSDYARTGLAHVGRAGLSHLHALIEEPNYLAMPRLVAERRRFTFIFVDGWHSFDHALLDIFYSDLLLEDGGILTLHDTDWASVNKAVRFLERHKPYERMSPPPALTLASPISRAARRAFVLLSGPTAAANARARRVSWRSLAAYRKVKTEVTPQGVANF